MNHSTFEFYMNRDTIYIYKKKREGIYVCQIQTIITQTIIIRIEMILYNIVKSIIQANEITPQQTTLHPQGQQIVLLVNRQNKGRRYESC